MFFCDYCATRKGWPTSIRSSYGACEICDAVGRCNDVPSNALPRATWNDSAIEVPVISPPYKAKHRAQD